MTDTAVCVPCGNTYTITARGTLRKHGACPGGGTLPAQTTTDLPHDRGTEEPVATAMPPSTDPVDAMFNQPQQPAGERHQTKRDKWGRYLLPHPTTGQLGAWMRATTFAEIPEDKFALSQWSQRLTLLGASQRPDITALAHPLDVKRDKDQLNRLVEQAKEAAGGSRSANLGTALHRFAEDRDAGTGAEVPPAHRADIDAYSAALTRHGVEVVPHLIERITCLPQFASGNALGVAGKFDRIYRMPDGSYVIGDLKTGDITYGMQKIAVQLALYAHGVNENGIYDPAEDTWTRIPQVRTDYGIVVHLPVGSATCTLHKVDLVRGWQGAQLCQTVKNWRGQRGLSEPLAPPSAAPQPVREPAALDWAWRFSQAGSREEMSALYQDAVAARVPADVLEELVHIGKSRLAELVRTA